MNNFRKDLTMQQLLLVNMPFKQVYSSITKIEQRLLCDWLKCLPILSWKLLSCSIYKNLHNLSLCLLNRLSSCQCASTTSCGNHWEDSSPSQRESSGSKNSSFSSSIFIDFLCSEIYRISKQFVI